MKPWFLLVPALLAAATGCSHVPWNPYGGWRAVKTKHITMYTNTHYVYQRTLDPMEVAFSAIWSSLFKSTDVAPVEVLFLEDDQFLATMGRNRSDREEGCGATVARLQGEGNLGKRGLIVIDEDSRLSSAAHRLAHVFLNAISPSYPLWVHEAYASYVETIQYREGGGTAEACLGHLNPDESLIPLQELFSMTWAQFDESKRVDWYRHTARTVLDYLLTGEKGALRPRHALMMAKLARGHDTNEVFLQVFPDVTLAEFEKKMNLYRKDSEMRPRGLCPVSYPIPPGRTADFGERRIEPVAKADMERLFKSVWSLPRRGGYVDWYPAEMSTLAGVFKP